MYGIEGFLSGFGIEHAGVALLLAGLAMNSRKVLKAGGALGSAMATGAMIMIVLAVLVAAGAMDPNIERIVDLGAAGIDGLRWLLRFGGVGI